MAKDELKEQLRKAQELGYEAGYQQGMLDANIQRSIGYLTHLQDMMDVIEKNPTIFGYILVRELEAIHAIRRQTNSYIHPSVSKGK